MQRRCWAVKSCPSSCTLAAALTVSRPAAAITTLTESLVSLPKHMVFTVSEQVSLLRSRAPLRAVTSTTILLFFASFIENVVNTRPLGNFAMILGLASSGVLHASAVTSALQTLSAASSSSAAKSCLPSTSVVAEFLPVVAACWRMRVAQQDPAPARGKTLLTAGSSCLSNIAAANFDGVQCSSCAKSLCPAFDHYASHAPGATAESSMTNAIRSAAIAILIRQHSHRRAGRAEIVATNPAPHALRFCMYKLALLYSRVHCADLGSAGVRLVAFVPDANLSCAADFFWPRRRLAGMLSRRARARGGGSACWRGRNWSACHWRGRVLRGMEEPITVVDRRNQEVKVTYCQLWATLAPTTSRKDSSKDVGGGAHDTTTVQTASDAASDVSLLETQRARSSRSYRVIALFRSDLSLEKVRESVGSYVLQLRKWRCARPRALYRGHRRLAYLIKGQESAHIVELTFDIFPSAVRYFRMKLDVDPAVLRFMILRNPPLPRSIVRRQYLIPPDEFSELVKYSGSSTT